jgi:hypothetical protein
MADMGYILPFRINFGAPKISRTLQKPLVMSLGAVLLAWVKYQVDTSILNVIL